MAFSAPSGGVITQTGRDLNFSGLTGNAGVSITVSSGVTYYDFGTNRLLVLGTIFHDPEREVLIFRHISTNINTVAPIIYVYASTAGWVTSGFTYSRDGQGYLVVNRSSHGLQAGDAVQIRSTNVGAVNRLHRIRSVTASSFTLEDSIAYTTPTSIGDYLQRPCYNYGREITSGGRTRYSRGTGIFVTGNSVSIYSPNEASFSSAATSSQGGFF